MSKIKGNIYLYSTGGCGTRMLYKWLKPRCNKINGQGDVHYGKPPKNLRPNDRVIHLFGNPIPIISSFFYRHKNNGRFIVEHSNNMRIPTPDTNVKNFIKSNRDQFQLEKHFNKHKNRPNSILINYHTLWDNLPEILKYIGLEDDIDSFPAKVERRSKEFFTKEQTESLQKTYKGLIEDIEKSVM